MLTTEDLLPLVLVLQMTDIQAQENIGKLESALAAHVREQRRLNRSLPQDKVRISWDNFCGRVSTTHFRRMFRMSQTLFDALCVRTCDRIGPDRFRAEAHLREKADGEELSGKSPPICGEVKVALCLGMLAGGSHLDLVPLFDVSSGHVHVVFKQFLQWVKLAFQFPLTRLLREQQWRALEESANEFAEKTNGAFYGPFCSLDGLAVRMRSPTLNEVSDPGNYHCRKGFFALNVQGTCDRKKRFLWCFPGNKGSTHDSTAFTGSKLYDLPVECQEELAKRGSFAAGDSAYGLTPFLLVPCDQNEVKEGGDPNGMRDSFNFHLSSCRIYIECAFGELVVRWGILWRTLLFDIKKCQDVAQVCMPLQNFIIDNRDSLQSDQDSRHFETFNVHVDETQQEITRQTGEMPRAVVTDGNEPKRSGRRTVQEVELRERGMLVRKTMTVALAANDLRRPLNHDMHCNSHGHIYFS